MSSPAERTGDSELVAGRLEGVPTPDLVWALCRDKKTGVLHVAHRTIRKSVYIEEGQIVFAASRDPDDRLGEFFLRQGTVTVDQLDDAVRNLQSGKRIGTLLVEAGSLSPGDLVRGVLSQVEAIVLDLFAWDEGVYRFEEGPLPTEEVITLGMNTSEILSSGIRRVRSFGRIRQAVGGPRTVFGLSEEWREVVNAVHLGEAESMLTAQLGKGCASVDQLCHYVLLSNFEIYQTLWALKVQGIVEEKDPGLDPRAKASHRGRFEHQSFPELLIQLCRANETGVLYVSRRSVERSFHVEGGRCVFATSSDPDDGLIAYLLMRGVISLRDREETAKRLLSNKRVGAILRELGVIDEIDLREMVRQQLSEIVYDTFRWDSGDYAFVHGELPTIEAIKLESSLDTLIAEGLRRVASWSRVRQGCGGLDMPLTLTPLYLDVLDGMNAGTDEWQVVNALKIARTAREICREVETGTFRACQILWTLRQLGALRECPEAEIRAPEPEEAPADEPTPEPQRIEVAELDSGPATVATASGVPADDALEQGPDTSALQAEPVEEPAEEPVESVTPVDPPTAVAVDDGEDDRATPRRVSPALVAAALGRTAVGSAPGSDGGEIDPPKTDDTHGIEPAVAAVPDAARIELSVAEPDATPVEDEPESPHAMFDAGSHAAEPSDEPVLDSDPAPIPVPEIPSSFLRADDDGGDATPADSIESHILDLDEIDHATETVEILETAAIEIDEAADEILVEEEPTFDLPAEAEQAIARFNAIQRMVFRAVRSEVGAGAANFIRACCDSTGGPEADPVGEATLHADGTWDPQDLRRALVEQQIDDPGSEYQRLIDRELEQLRVHVDEARMADILRSIEKLSTPGASDALHE